MKLLQFSTDFVNIMKKKIMMKMLFYLCMYYELAGDYLVVNMSLNVTSVYINSNDYV